MAFDGSKMMTKSMFGDQSVSKRQSSPAYGFGSGTRETTSKIFISSEHAKLQAPLSSPGPSAYTLKSSIAGQVDGRKMTAPQWVFGSSNRFSYENRSTATPGPGSYNLKESVGPQVTSKQQSQPIYSFGTANRDNMKNVFLSPEHTKSRHGVASPGPMNYTLRAAVGKQDSSKLKNQPAWVFGSQQRFKYDHVKRAASSPGPGAYSLRDAVGGQVVSNKDSAPVYGFGTSDRTVAAKIYLSAEHEKMSAGFHSPGPCNYTLPESTGKQPSSQKSNVASWGFGTASRWATQGAKTRSQTPGPGAYCV